MEEVTQLRRVEGWFRVHAPEWQGAVSRRPLFRPGASPEALARLEAVVGAVPETLRALLAERDGCRQSIFPLPQRAAGLTWRLLGVDEIVRAWRLCGEVSRIEGTGPIQADGPVDAVWWSPTWVPIAGDGTGDLLCLDRRPPAGGVPGQVVQYLHDFGRRSVVFASVEAWLREVADDLEAGVYTIVDGELERTGPPNPPTSGWKPT